MAMAINSSLRFSYWPWSDWLDLKWSL